VRDHGCIKIKSLYKLVVFVNVFAIVSGQTSLYGLQYVTVQSLTNYSNASVASFPGNFDDDVRTHTSIIIVMSPTLGHGSIDGHNGTQSSQLSSITPATYKKNKP
jgi:hypothetical protein